jgi:hypothetical protein
VAGRAVVDSQGHGVEGDVDGRRHRDREKSLKNLLLGGTKQGLDSPSITNLRRAKSKTSA